MVFLHTLSGCDKEASSQVYCTSDKTCHQSPRSIAVHRMGYSRYVHTQPKFIVPQIKPVTKAPTRLPSITWATPGMFTLSLSLLYLRFSLLWKLPLDCRPSHGLLQVCSHSAQVYCTSDLACYESSRSIAVHCMGYSRYFSAQVHTQPLNNGSVW